jgi:hypothetical protein
MCQEANTGDWADIWAAEARSSSERHGRRVVRQRLWAGQTCWAIGRGERHGRRVERRTKEAGQAYWAAEAMGRGGRSSRRPRGRGWRLESGRLRLGVLVTWQLLARLVYVLW